MQSESPANDIPIATCAACGTDIYTEDAAKSVTMGDVPVCPACSPEALRALIGYAGEMRQRSTLALKVGVALVLAGIALAGFHYFTGGPENAPRALTAMALFFGLSGLPVVWAGMYGNAGEQAVRSVSGGSAKTMLPAHVLFLKGVSSFLICMIIAPIGIYRNYLLIKQTENEVAACNDLLQKYA